MEDYSRRWRQKDVTGSTWYVGIVLTIASTIYFVPQKKNSVVLSLNDLFCKFFCRCPLGWLSHPPIGYIQHLPNLL